MPHNTKLPYESDLLTLFVKAKHCGNFGTAPSSKYLHLKMGHEASKYYDFIVHAILTLP